MKITSPWSEVAKHLIFLAVGWLMFCILAGLFQTFDLLEVSMDDVSYAILEGSKISGIIFFTGIIVAASMFAIISPNNKREP